MVQKTIWIFCLIIGINILINLLTSCGKKSVETAHFVKYKYVNNSSHDVFINFWRKINDSLITFKYVIDKSGNLEQNIERMSGSTAGLIIYSDSVRLSFDTQIENTFTNKADDASKYNILQIGNYSKMIKPNGEDYTYIITNDDYNYAVGNK